MIDIKKIGVASTIAMFSVPVMLGGCGSTTPSQLTDEANKVTDLQKKAEELKKVEEAKKKEDKEKAGQTPSTT
ncbi:hypothetical protein AP064_01570 [Candidatus Liberibacter solanacearum]|uniref:Lipoprotein n=1 Tax=Candidatus Liberibacter solanacearum TaxID=556287 RepID=A0A0F4VJC3_9HYPH|nr:hypothetical protein [Candidatus Liberibacter solanacearum]KJZ81546.1 hypothetical protein KP07_00245 [Candidatus Liberibacter solanacearum]KJZ82449.1 hypothetical protein DJ66_0049 [Candidatus Liberibacter solanacearum]KQC49180.1 hypothetical protein AP064_01570 [Candidatus Liberibacter solanacearum]